MALAIGMVVLLLPAFNQLTGKQISLQVDVRLFLSVMSILLFTGIVAGSYPALYLSKFNHWPF